MNRGPSNGGRVGAMQKRLKAEWQAKVNALATLAPGQTFKIIPLTNDKAGNVPVEQITERAKANGYTAIVRGTALYLATPVKVAKPKAA
jgi:hypothetical protein